MAIRYIGFEDHDAFTTSVVRGPIGRLPGRRKLPGGAARVRSAARAQQGGRHAGDRRSVSGRILGRVPTGQQPHELVTSTDGRFAFASNYGTGPAPGHTISLIDIAAQNELRRIDIAPFSRPHGLAFANGKLYFTAEASKLIARYDPAADKVDWQFETGQMTRTWCCRRGMGGRSSRRTSARTACRRFSKGPTAHGRKP